jgi:hypothetical protein
VKEVEKKSKEKLLIRTCHSCLKINESEKELERCTHCNKSFLPLRYFDKIHHEKETKWENYFYPTDLIEEEDLIKGLFVLW